MRMVAVPALSAFVHHDVLTSASSSRLLQVLRSLPSWARAVPGWPGGLHVGVARPLGLSRGVAVTVCGLGDTAGTWSRLHQALVDDGLVVTPVVWNPVGASMGALAERVTATARQAMAEADTDRLHLVGHSFGGVIARVGRSTRRAVRGRRNSDHGG